MSSVSLGVGVFISFTERVGYAHFEYQLIFSLGLLIKLKESLMKLRKPQLPIGRTRPVPQTKEAIPSLFEGAEE